MGYRVVGAQGPRLAQLVMLACGRYGRTEGERHVQLNRIIPGTAEFRLLGVVEVVVDGRSLDLGPISRRAVLAALLMDMGHPVQLDTLAARLWDDMPAAARSSVYANISRLRSTLRDACVDADLRRSPSGYQLSVPPGSVDLGRFRQLVELSHDAQGDEERAGLLLQALRVWRGPALAGMTSMWAARVREALAEQRLAAAARWAQAEFRLGRPAGIPAQLSDLLVEHPLSEPLTFEVIRALAASGRTAEALDFFARLRKRLADDLGAEPAADISQLHLEILRGTLRVPQPLERQRAAVSSAPVPPAQLPPWGTGFIGRDAELSWMSKQASGDINVLVITGIGGVGKTSLAVRWSTSVRRQFPDGQLYVDLRGFSSQPPMQAAEVLVQFLRSLGMPAADIPVNPAEAAAQYRSMLADRKVLVLLDNAENASQVRPLLPAAPGCMVVVTSRNKLTGLVARDAARRFELDVLSPDSAIELLRNDLSTDDYGGRDALARLAAACGYLPLALRVAAARVSELPSGALGDYTRALQGGNRIGVLTISGDGEASVEGAFELSYRALSAPAKRMFCMLGVFPGTEFSVNAAATLLGHSAEASQASLSELAIANMIQPRATDRFGCHDLLRAYAQSLAASVLDPAERQAALERLCKSYLKTIDKAAQLIYPHLFRLPHPDVSSTAAQGEFDNDLEALCWLDLEQGNIIAIIRTAGTHGPRHLAWLLADSLRGYLYHRQNTVEWFTVAEAGLAAAVAENDVLGQAAAHHSMALASHSVCDFPGAIKHLHQARRLSEQGSWRHGHTAALCNLGIIATDQGQLSAAESYYTEALEANRSDGIDVAMAVNLGNLAEVHHMLGNLESAERFARAALDRYLLANSPTGQADVLTCLGAVCRELNKTCEAEEYLRQSLEMQRETGDLGSQANALAELALLLRQTGQLADSVEASDEAIQLSELLNAQKLEAKAHNAMAIARHTQGRPIEARIHYHSASAAAAKAGTPYQRTIALIGLANACRDSGELAEALEYSELAWELARTSSYRRLEFEAQAIIVALRTSHPV